MYERKYKLVNNQVVKRADGVPVPEDEPLFIFRGKDSKALSILIAYHALLDNLEQKAEVKLCIQDFKNFQVQNPDKMAEPTP